MANLRFAALNAVLTREPDTRFAGDEPLASIYGQDVFTLDKLQAYVSEDVYKNIINNLGKNPTLDRELADTVAHAIRTWAQSKGVTHYTHWFQPLTGLTAEKHDSFFEMKGSQPLEAFSGKQLSQQEPDASSFPSGGIRSTFEARGYTAWDPSSPVFIFNNVLCIPSISFSYTGEALDYKTPLLRTISKLNDAATAVMQYFDRNVKQVSCTLGPEQEYFIIDEAFYKARPDLVLAGRTVFGAAPARGQQLEDHYFGSITPRVYNFMVEMEREAIKLGIPLRTRHNEVAPSQFECAPQFEDLNVSVDHNQLLMDLLDRVARKHHLRVLLHEKPFAGINGSGKHNNWSMSTDTGVNLLAPGKNPKDNLRFFTFLVCTIHAVHKYADLLRASIASAGNDHRLGANEAPPAIISVFLGTELTRALAELEGGVVANVASGTPMKLGVPHIPEVLKDNTDRNRTSPFAFTGNKFEFRAVGSAFNNAGPMTVLNTIVTDSLIALKTEVDALIKGGKAKDDALLEVLQKMVKESKAVCFEGDNYSDEWAAEAKSRGLSNVKNTAEALDAFLAPAVVELFDKHGILNETELHARWDILNDIYIKKIDIEARLILDITRTQIVPAAMSYVHDLTKTIGEMQDLGINKELYVAQLDLVKQVSEHVSGALNATKVLEDALGQTEQIEDLRKKAVAYRRDVFERFDEIRGHVDALELLVPDDKWPLPKYPEILFMK